MKVVLLSIICFYVSAVEPYDIQSQWREFKDKFQKTYNEEEENNRVMIFEKNLRKIQENNQLFDNNLVTFKMGITQFADMMPEEFEADYLRNIRILQKQNDSLVYKTTIYDDLPDRVDWRDKGAVNIVRHQGFCGACYALTAVGIVESQYFLKTGTLLSLSAQNIVDCSEPNGNHKCKSGSVNKALDYIRENGIMLEKDYPYAGRNGKCRFDPSKSVMKIKGYIWVEENEDALEAAVANIGPIGVSIDSREWQLYASGILVAEKPYVAANHAVIIVGYGTENGTDYWLLKNSFGTQWGENGYIRIGRNMDNQFGISDFGIYPTLN